MKARSATINRKTEETDILLSLGIDGTGVRDINTPYGFLNHMLGLFAKHGLFDLSVQAKGDVDVDDHHIVEDIGIVLGTAFSRCLGDKRGINRYGFFILPMDEAVATVAIDFSGRYSFTYACPFTREKIGDVSTELFYDFWGAFAQNAKVSLAVKVENGRNDHHKAEALFKAVARACRMACEVDPRAATSLPSTKGTL
jgi:imidazoleglycerol phosphate dehydratase HisB